MKTAIAGIALAALIVPSAFAAGSKLYYADTLPRNASLSGGLELTVNW